VEDSLGEGVGVAVLDGSFGTDSKGLVFTCDDGNIVRGRVEGTWVMKGGTGTGWNRKPEERRAGEGEGKERRREEGKRRELKTASQVQRP
jgi:hypothetical protein